MPLEEYKLPTAIFVSSIDHIVHSEDTEWLIDHIQDAVVQTKSFDIPHSGFILAKDMGYVDHDLIPLLDEYGE